MCTTPSYVTFGRRWNYDTFRLKFGETFSCCFFPEVSDGESGVWLIWCLVTVYNDSDLVTLMFNDFDV